MAASCPASRFKRLLLPALGGPTIAIRTPLLQRACENVGLAEHAGSGTSRRCCFFLKEVLQHSTACCSPQPPGAHVSQPAWSAAIRYRHVSLPPDELAASCCRQVPLHLPPQRLHQRQHPGCHIISNLLVLSKIYDSFEPRCRFK